MGDLVAILLGVVLVGAFAFAAVKGAQRGHRHNWGFGTDWNCTYAGQGDPVCIKKPSSN